MVVEQPCSLFLGPQGSLRGCPWERLIDLSLLELFALELFAKVFVVEDVGGRCGSGGIGAFVRCRSRFRRGVGDVVKVAAREYGTSDGGEA